MNRRQFIQQSILASTAATFLGSTGLSKGVNWEIGCFNRPWTKWSFDQTVKAIKAAGYKTIGLLTRTKDDPFIAAEATPEYLQALKGRIAVAGLTANMASL